MTAAPLLSADGLVKHYRIGGGGWGRPRVVHALSEVSLAILPGETLAVVGESGCGKTTLARCLTWLTEPTAGTIRAGDENVAAMIRRAPLRFRRQVQIVFQDPYASLSPRRMIGDTIGDALRIHSIGTRAERRERVAALLNEVGLSRDYLGRYPHELSGGQRQRVAIARALAVRPAIVICDEPVSALDVSIQAQVVNLLRDLQRERGMAYLFISHNLALMAHISDRMAVMYLGQIVELGPTPDFRRRLLHPYSQALFAASPVIGRERAVTPPLTGDVPSPIDPPAGCRFHTRCPHRRERCTTEMPALRALDGSMVRCHFAEEIAASSPSPGRASGPVRSDSLSPTGVA